jgi:hypothetical protein
MAKSNSSISATKSATAAACKTFALPCPYGQFRVTENEAYDHIEMRANQLHAMTLLITGTGFDIFKGLDEKRQHDVLWMLEQVTDEIRTLIPIIGGDVGRKAELEVAA